MIAVLLGIATLTLLVGLLLVRPLLKRPEPGTTAPTLAVYRDQLAEIERDQASGRLTDAEASAATVEVKRRLLQAADRGGTALTVGRTRGAAVAIGVALVGALALYSVRGTPALPDQPHADRPADGVRPSLLSLTPEQRLTAMRGMVAELAERLAGTPDDIDGWLRLGDAYRALGDHDQAIAAFAHAADRAPNRVDVLVRLARAVYPPERAAVEPPTAGFFQLQRRILALDPGNLEALWFTAQAEAEAGNPKIAADFLRQLVSKLPADNPMRARVEEVIADLDPS